MVSAMRVTFSELEKLRQSLPDPMTMRYAISLVRKPVNLTLEPPGPYEKVSDEIRWRAEVCEDGWTWVSETPLNVVLA